LAQQASSRDDTDQSVWIYVANFLVFIMADVIESICVLRHDAIAEAVEGGWLAGAYSAALKLDNKSPYPTLESGLDNCIKSVCRYSLPVYKVVMAVGETYPMREWLDTNPTITDPKTAPLWHPFITMYNRSLDAFRDGDLNSFVDLCQNSTVRFVTCTIANRSITDIGGINVFPSFTVHRFPRHSPEIRPGVIAACL
jgi:hypothetical protein